MALVYCWDHNANSHYLAKHKMTKIFKCKFCNKKDRIAMTRQGIREHLKIHLKKSLFSQKSDTKRKSMIIEEEI